MRDEPTPRLAIGVASEAADTERRVALVPADVKRLLKRVDVVIEQGAGERAGFADREYEEAGARVVDARQLAASAAITLMIQAPPLHTALASGAVIASLGGRDPETVERLRASGVVHLGLERLPRSTRAQSMDVLSSQASIAGYAAVIEGARELDILLPMLTTAAGNVKPAKMIALGAGVAGLQALATARRLGAVTYGFDVREAAREQVESLGARFVFPEVDLAGIEGSGGYAGAQSEDQQARLQHALIEHLAPMQLIVTSAQIPGKSAPILISHEGLAALSPGTVIVDLAAESGGNTTRTRSGEIVTVGGVRIIGRSDLASSMAADASRLFSGNMRALVEHLINDAGELTLDPADPIIAGLLGEQPALATAA